MLWINSSKSNPRVVFVMSKAGRWRYLRNGVSWKDARQSDETVASKPDVSHNS